MYLFCEDATAPYLGRWLRPGVLKQENGVGRRRLEDASELLASPTVCIALHVVVEESRRR